MSQQDGPLTVAECLQAITILRDEVSRLGAENVRLAGLISCGFAHAKPKEPLVEIPTRPLAVLP